MADTGGYRTSRNRAGWRHLGVFWLAVLTSLATGAGACNISDRRARAFAAAGIRPQATERTR